MVDLRIPAPDYFVDEDFLHVTMAACNGFKQKERLTLSQWSEKYMRLSSEYASQAAGLRLFGWQKEIFDAFTDPNVKDIVLCCGTQLTKCLDISTPIPTPEGWKFQGHLKVGDRVFSDSGKVCHVIGVSPVFTDRTCFRITFDDDSVLIADASHQWPVFDRMRKGKSFLLTTQEMFDGFGKRWKHNRNANRYRISCADALDCEPVDLPIDPYIFGCWLGDGSSNCSNITVDLRDGVYEQMQATGEACRIVSVDKRRKHVAKIAVGGNYRNGCSREDTLQGRLNALNVINDKHIPLLYLRSSIEQRLALLQGLLDTDGGTVRNGSVENHSSGVCLSITCKSLVRSAKELILSLGFKPTYKEIRAKLYGRDCGPCYKLYFTVYTEDHPFRLARKASALRSFFDPHSRVTESMRRSIVSIEQIPSVPVCCIAVDSPSHLYLCGKSMIPTHNTLLIQSALAYIITNAPGPTLIVQPKDEDARTFSKERLSPMIRDNDCLRGIISDSTNDGKNTIVTKLFPGGSLSLVGAIAPGNLARRSIRYLFCDEIDKYPLSAGAEGDPYSLAKKRTATYEHRAKTIRCCSPTVVGRSQILAAYDESDQRKPWVKCPYCGELQILKWRDDHGYRVRWDTSLAPSLQAQTAQYHCGNRDCDKPWSDVQRWAACENAEWCSEAPFTGTAGFWISNLYSRWYKVTQLADEFLKAKEDRDKLKVFINTALAEGWVDGGGESPEIDVLMSSREPYKSGIDALVPKRGLFLTAAVDVQDNPARLEVEVVAWGRNRENWSVYYGSIEENLDGHRLPVTHPRLWERLDTEILQRYWKHENGGNMSIMVMTIDTGKRPAPVYEFARKHTQLSYIPATGGIKLLAPRTVVPIKGDDDNLQILSGVSKEDAARQRQGVRIYKIGTHCCKQEIYDLLKYVRRKDNDEPTTGCYHFPDEYLTPYFEGLTAEVRLVNENGKVEWTKKPGRTRNEPLDLKVYNRGAASLVGIDRFQEKEWRQLEARLGLDQNVVQSELSASILPSSPAGAGVSELKPPPTLTPAPPAQTQKPLVVSTSAPAPTPVPKPQTPATSPYMPLPVVRNPVHRGPRTGKSFI